MSESTSGPDLFNLLADEFADRHRRGERPPVTEYTDKYPELADQIRELFPALVAIEELGAGSGPAAGPDAPRPETAGPIPERLGDYRILREIARGGMGIVYEAVQESLGRHVALKVLPQFRTRDPSLLERFQREARAAAMLHHTNIVPVFGVGVHNGVHHYAMQFIQGQSLDAVLREVKRMRGLTTAEPSPSSVSVDEPGIAASVAIELVSGRFAGQSEAPAETVSVTGSRPPPPGKDSATIPREAGPGPISSASSILGQSGYAYYRSVARIGVQTAEALAYAHHQKVLHRDIKPSNLLLDLQGTVWVTDFGLAKAEGTDALTQTGDIVGTVRYMAPERFRGQVDARSDVHALGLTLYEMLTLEPAFAADQRSVLIDKILHEEPSKPRQIDPRIPSDLETITLKAIAKDPTDRYRTASELAEDLRRYLTDRPILARRITPAERAWRWARRNKLVASLMALLAVVIFGGFAGMAVLWARAARLAMTESQARDLAQEQTRIAQAQAKIASNRAEELRRHDYISRVNLAYRELLANNVRQSLELLDGCPEDLRSWEWSYVSRQCHLELRTFRAPGPAINAVAFSPDGRRLAFASGSSFDRPGGSGDLVVLDVATGQEIFAHRGHPGGIRAVAFSPVGQRLASGHAATLTVCDATTGRERWHKTEPGGVTLLSLAYSPDGRRMMAGYGDADKWGVGYAGYAKLWDATTGDVLIDRFPGRRGGVFSVAFSPDGAQVAMATSTGPLEVWDLASCTQVHTMREHDTYVWAVAFSPDGRYLASGGHDSSIRLWDRTTGAQIRTYAGRPGITGLAFSPDGQWIVSAGDACRLWSVDTGLELAIFHGPSQRVAFSPDGSQIASGSDDQVKLWFATPNLQLTVGGHGAHVKCIAFSPDGKLVASAAQNNHPLWDPTTGEELLSFSTEGGLGALAFSPDGRRLASAALNPEVTVRDATSGRKILTLMGTPHDVIRSSVAFSPDGQTLAVADNDESLTIWDVITGRRLHTLRGHTAPVWGVAFSPDGQTVASASDDQTVRVWSASTGQELLTLKGHAASVRSVAFSPDGRQLASVGGSSLNSQYPGGDGDGKTSGQKLATAGASWHPFGEVKVWDPSTGRELYQLRGHTDMVNSVAFSPDGRRLTTGSEDGTIKLWDTATGDEVFTLRGHDRVICVAFSPDGRRIVSGSSDKTAKVWDLDASRAEVLSRREALAQVASGESSLLAGRWGEAAAALTRALSLKLDNPRLRRARGQAFAGLGQFQKAAADFDEVVRVLPLSASMRAERGRFYFTRSRFGNAAQDFTRAEELDPDNPGLRYARAVSLLLTGDLAGYRAACAAMLSWFKDHENVFAANRVAYACIYGPDAVADMPGLVRAAERSAPATRGGIRIVGAALFRAGRHKEALNRFEQAHRVFQPRAWDWLFLAMIHGRLGHAEEAGRLLEKADRWITEADRSTHQSGGIGPIWSSVFEGPTIRLLRSEAEAMVRFDPVFPADPFAR